MRLRRPYVGNFILTNNYQAHLAYSNAPGVDWALPSGTPVYAAGPGTVTYCRWGKYGGRYVMVNHGGGLLTLYSHLSWVSAVREEQVSAGQLLGLSGETGRCVDAHLHFAVKHNGQWVDPEPFLDAGDDSASFDQVRRTSIFPQGRPARR